MGREVTSVTSLTGCRNGDGGDIGYIAHVGCRNGEGGDIGYIAHVGCRNGEGGGVVESRK